MATMQDCPQPLQDVSRYVDQDCLLWENRLDWLEDYLREIKAKEQK